MRMLQETGPTVVSTSDTIGQAVRKGRWMQNGEDQGQAGTHKHELDPQWDPSLVLLLLTLETGVSCIC